jgi:hypothetical protein
MLRRLYRCTLRLHPPGFRERFGDEMLSIFDQQTGTPEELRLLLDSIFSLFRQWILRPNLGIALAAASLPQPAFDGIPSFVVLDTFRPRKSAVIHGTLLSLILFYVIGFTIHYNRIHIMHAHMYGFSLGLDWPMQPTRSPRDLREKSDQPKAATPEKSRRAAAPLRVDVLPVELQKTAADAMISSESRSSSALARPSGDTVQLQLRLYVGEYISASPPLKISIRIKDDHLSLDMAGHSPRTLSPLSQTQFVMAGGGNGLVEFVLDDQGRIRALSMVEAGQRITAQRH